MKTLTSVFLAASLFAAPALAAPVIIAPGGAGDAQSPTPINYYGSGGSQTQQIYSSSFFTGPTTITGVSFRAYPGAAPSGFFSNTVSVSDLVVTLGTTAASPNENSGVAPSATFASNLSGGSTVFSGAITLSTAATGAGPQPFDYTVNFTTPFTYNPGSGNLLLDFLIPTGATVSGSGFGFLTFDAANDFNDGVFSVVNINSGSDLTGTLSTAAAITQFHTAAAVPEPASWALMIGGLLLTGAAIRARRTTVRA